MRSMYMHIARARVTMCVDADVHWHELAWETTRDRLLSIARTAEVLVDVEAAVVELCARLRQLGYRGSNT